MCATQKEKMVTIIGGAYFQPIADLLEKLARCLPKAALNEVQVNTRENGYSVSICVLSVLCLESYSMRVRHINRNRPFSQTRNVLKFLKSLYPTFPNFGALAETFILRDLLAHNHLWVIEFLWDDDVGMKLLDAQKDSLRVDHKYKDHVDIGNRKTKQLGLNVFPTRVNRVDVGKVLKTIWDALIYLERQNRNQCYVSHLQVLFEEKHVNFGKLISNTYGKFVSEPPSS